MVVAVGTDESLGTAREGAGGRGVDGVVGDRRLAKALFAKAFVAELLAIDGDAERTLQRVRRRWMATS